LANVFETNLQQRLDFFRLFNDFYSESVVGGFTIREEVEKALEKDRSRRLKEKNAG